MIKPFSSARGSIVLLPIAVSVVILWALIGAEYDIAKRWSKEYDEYYSQGSPRGSRPRYDEHWSSPDYGSDNPETGIFFMRSFAMIGDTIHLPFHIYSLYKNPTDRHPVSRLCAIILVGCMWAASIAMTLVWSVTSYNAQKQKMVTFRLAATNLAFEILILLSYAVYLVFTAMAVHRWRKGRSAHCAENGHVEKK